jgi:hypothetical protein
MDVIFYTQLNRANFGDNADVNLFNGNVHAGIESFVQMKIE